MRIMKLRSFSMTGHKPMTATNDDTISRQLLSVKLEANQIIFSPLGGADVSAGRDTISDELFANAWH